MVNKKEKQKNLGLKLAVSTILLSVAMMYVVYKFVSVSVALLTLPMFAAVTRRNILTSEIMQFVVAVVLLILSILVGRNIERFYESKKAPLLKRYKFLLIFVLVQAALCLITNIFADDYTRIDSTTTELIICLIPAFITILFRHYVLNKKEDIKTVTMKPKTKKRQKPEDFEEL
jgi:small-conductance mechanosensitive channel